MVRVSKVVQDRLNHQREIIEKYGVDQVDQAHCQFCLVCELRDRPGPGCSVNLLPLTLAGGSCPYFTLE